MHLTREGPSALGRGSEVVDGSGSRNYRQIFSRPAQDLRLVQGPLNAPSVSTFMGGRETEHAPPRFAHARDRDLLVSRRKSSSLSMPVVVEERYPLEFLVQEGLSAIGGR